MAVASYSCKSFKGGGICRCACVCHCISVFLSLSVSVNLTLGSGCHYMIYIYK